MGHTSTRAATPADRPRSDAAHEMEEQIIVIGGGLAGLSAAHTVLEHGGRVLLLDKCPFLGGNSTKATSGINGALTRTQAAKGIQDSADKFEADIVKGAAGVGHTQPPAHTVPLAKVRRPPTNRRAFFLSRDICPRDSPPGSRADPPPHPAPKPPVRPGPRPGQRRLRRLAHGKVRPRPLPRLPARYAPAATRAPPKNLTLKVNNPKNPETLSLPPGSNRTLLARPRDLTPGPTTEPPQAVIPTPAPTAARSASPASPSPTP